MTTRSVFVHEMIDPSGDSLRLLEEHGFEVRRGGVPMWRPERFLTEDELIANGTGMAALMGSSGHRITARVIDALPELRFISKYGIGVDSIDLQAATARGILVTNTPIPEDYEAVCEGTIALLLAAMKRLDAYTATHIRSGGWRLESAFPLFVQGSTIGLVGFGRIGRGVARRLAGWDVELIAADPVVTDMPEHVRRVELDELLATSDVISLHAVPNADNRHLLNRDTLARTRPGVVIVNTARGSLIDLDALADAVADGHVAAAALDVYEQEPPDADHPLFALPAVIASPHVAGWTRQTCEAMGRTGAEALIDMVEGRRPAHLVNPAAYDVLGQTPR